MPGAYTRDAGIPGPNDAAVHQYTATPWDTRTYDATGALASKVQSDGSAGSAFTYDALGQLARYGDTRGSLLLADNFNDGDYDGWSVTQGSYSVVDGALKISQGYYGWPSVYRSFTQADADVSVSYRFENVYSSLELIPRDYYHSSADCGTLRLLAQSNRMYLEEYYGGQWTPLAPDVLLPSTPGETYRYYDPCDSATKFTQWGTFAATLPVMVYSGFPKFATKIPKATVMTERLLAEGMAVAEESGS